MTPTFVNVSVDVDCEDLKVIEHLFIKDYNNDI